MRYRLRHLDLDDKMCHQISLDVFEHIYPRQFICEQLSLHQAWEKRERALNMLTLIYVVLAAALWTRLAFPRVLERLGRPLHLLGLSLSTVRVEGSAISYRRAQLGWAPLKGLMARCCRPVCTPATKGAYRFGRRLVALDGSHVTFDAVVDSSAEAEKRLALEVLCSLSPDMFLLHDAQFTGLRFWQAVRKQGAHVMGPVPSHHLSSYLRQPSDGSYLAVYEPSSQQAKEGRKPLLVRVIEYRITDARLGEPEQVYRLATTWLNPRTAPALELIDCYHKRWEVEVVIDEIKTHQRLQQPVLRSRTPEGVRQEVHALLLAHYAVRALLHQAACQAEVPPDRLSFTDAIFVLSETTRELAQVERSQQEPLRQEMCARLTAQLLPERRLRANPRVLKKLYRKYKRKSQGEPALPPFDPQDQFLDFVVLLI